MHSEIYAKLDEAPPRFHSDAEARIQRTLRRWSRRLERVQVFLRDENGPRGGPVDMRCRLVLEIERCGVIVATGRGSDAFSALSAALQRARECIRRRKQRRVSRVRARPVRRALQKAA